MQRYGENSAIWIKVDALDINKRNDFLLDFGNAPDDVLDALNMDNGDLINYWRQIDNLKGERVRIKYLRSYKSIINNSDLLRHVHLGDPRIKLRKRKGISVSSEGVITGSHNLELLRNPPPPPLLDGEMSWKIPPPVDNSNPLNPSLGYQQGTIQRNMHDQIDPKTNTYFVKGDGSSIVTKKDNVYFPESYTSQRINEELALVNSRIDILKPFDIKINSLGEYSFFYQAPASDGHMLELVFHGANANPITATLNTIYPLNF